MKKRRIAIALFSLAFLGAAVGLSSCSGSSANETGDVNFEIQEGTKFKLNRISLDTSAAQTVFYVGDRFNHDDLIVNRTFLRVTDDLNETIVEKDLVDTTRLYSIDSSEVDMNHVGEYYVYVSVRYGDTVRRDNYKVKVLSSRFETTPNIEYVAGLNVTFSDNTAFKSYLLNSNELNVDSLVSGLKIKLCKCSNDADANSTQTFEDIDAKKVKIEHSVDKTKVGTYMIKVTYDNGTIKIDGKKYDNIVTSYVIVDVNNPITKMQIVGDAVFEATINGIDPEQKNWKVRITPTVGSTYEEPFTNAKYTIEDVDIFKWGSQQEIKIRSKENPDVFCTKVIQINESQSQNITAFYTLTPNVTAKTSDNKPSEILLGGSNYIYGPLPKKLDGDDYYSTGATYENGRASKDKYGSIAFDERITMTGTSQAIKLVLDKPSQIVVFFATSGNEERDLALYSEINGDIGDELQTAFTTSEKQEIVKATFTIANPGTYYLANTSGGIYLHGLIVAKSK